MTARVRQALTKDPADEMIDAALLGGTSSGQLHPSWGGRPAAAKGGKQRTARAGAESRTARTARTARDAGKDTAAGSPAPRKDATSPAAKPKPKATGATKGSTAAKGTGAGAKPKKKKKKKKKRPAAADEEAAASSGNWFEIQTQRAQSQAQMTRSLMSMYESGDGSHALPDDDDDESSDDEPGGDYAEAAEAEVAEAEAAAAAAEAAGVTAEVSRVANGGQASDLAVHHTSTSAGSSTTGSADPAATKAAETVTGMGGSPSSSVGLGSMSPSEAWARRPPHGFVSYAEWSPPTLFISHAEADYAQAQAAAALNVLPPPPPPLPT